MPTRRSIGAGRCRRSSRKWLDTFKAFPIRAKPASFNLDAVMQSLSESGRGK